MILDGKYIIVPKKQNETILIALYDMGYRFDSQQNSRSYEIYDLHDMESYCIHSNDNLLYWVTREKWILDKEKLDIKILLRSSKLKRIMK